MKPIELATLVERLAPTLLSLDTVLADAEPGRHEAGPGDADGLAGEKGLESLRSEHAARVSAVVQALSALGDPTPASALSRRAAAPFVVAATVEELVRTYRRIARASLAAGRAALHERLADCARDNLVVAAHVLADTIEKAVALLRLVAATGAGGTVAADTKFSVPESFGALAAFTPRRLAYASHAVRSALEAAATCRAVATDANATVHRLDAAQVAQSAVSVREPSARRRHQGFLPRIWSMLSLIGLGMLVHDALDNDCDHGGHP